jgi:hypothetical protein
MQTEIQQTMFGESWVLFSLFVFLPEEFALVVVHASISITYFIFSIFVFEQIIDL